MSKECNLSDDDVISAESTLGFGTHKMLKFSELKAHTRNWAKQIEGKGGLEAHWFKEQGFRCEVLRYQGGGWQKGRFIFRMEFIPDEPEVPKERPVAVLNEQQSPLDDLRSNL